LISFTEIKERRFADWAMHGIGLFDLNRLIFSLVGSLSFFTALVVDV